MAGGSIIGALRVVLGIDTAQFETGAKRAEDRAYALGERIGKSMRGAILSTTSLKSALVGLGGALALKELAGATQRAFDYADAIQDLADRTGASTKTIQEFRYAAQMSGSGVDVADAALEKFARSLGLAQAGGDAQVKLFRELGVTSGDFDTALRQTMDGLAKLPSTQQRAAVGFQLFGKSSATLTNLLGQGSRGFDDIAAKAHELGVVLEDDVIRNAGGANDKLDTLKMILNAQFANAVVQNANSLVSLADGVTSLTSALVKFMSTNPETALAVIGALAGSRAGLPGLAAGAIAGYGLGTKLHTNADDANSDLKFRLERFNAAKQNYRDAKAYRAGRGGRAISIGPAAEEFLKQDRLIQSARAAARAGGTGSTGTPRIAAVGDAEAASAAAKAKAAATKAARDAKREVEEARRNEEAFQSDRSRLDVEQLQLRQAITVDLRAAAELEHRRIDREAEAAATELAGKVVEGKLTQAKADQLLALQERNADLQRTAVNWKLDDELTREQVELSDAALGLRADLLRGDQVTARTAADRRRVELALLDIEYDRQRAALEAVLALHSSTDAEKAIAKARLGQLDALKGIDQANIQRGTLGSMGQYLDSLPKGAAELNEAYEAVAADGLRSLNDGLVDAIVNSKSLGDMFKNVANQIIGDLMRIAIQQAVIRPLAERLNTGGSSGAGLGGLVKSLLGGSSAGRIGPVDMAGWGGSVSAMGSSGLPKLAKGGSFRVAGNRGLDRNVLALNGVPTAMVNYGERVHVTPANDMARSSGGSPVSFDLRGAVMTSDLVQQMQTIAANTSGSAVGNYAASMQKRARRRLPG